MVVYTKIAGAVFNLPVDFLLDAGSSAPSFSTKEEI